MTADIVYVDDEPDPLLDSATAAGAKPRFDPYQPDQLNRAAVAKIAANLWVFDFFNAPPGQQDAVEQAVGNGMSVFQQLRYLVGDFRPPTVLISNALEAALGTEIDLARRHILAKQLGVEWVAPKTFQDGASSLPELLAIADAAKTIRKNAAELRDVAAANYTAEFAHKLLSLRRNAEWVRLAVRDVGSWRPPSLSNAGEDHRSAALQNAVHAEPALRLTRTIVAWLIRQALFYPSFLVSRRHVAVRLGITLACLDTALAQQTGLSGKLRPLTYNGILAEFVDTRWWSAGVDNFAWKLPRERAARTAALAALVAPVALEELNLIDPVVVANSDLVETDEIAAAADCVRASDESSPPNAPPAWVKIDDVRNDRILATKVRLEDQERIAEKA